MRLILVLTAVSKSLVAPASNVLQKRQNVDDKILEHGVASGRDVAPVEQQQQPAAATECRDERTAACEE
jgi:hypothetical protein